MTALDRLELNEADPCDPRLVAETETLTGIARPGDVSGLLAQLFFFGQLAIRGTMSPSARRKYLALFNDGLAQQRTQTASTRVGAGR